VDYPDLFFYIALAWADQKQAAILAIGFAKECTHPLWGGARAVTPQSLLGGLFKLALFYATIGVWGAVKSRCLAWQFPVRPNIGHCCSQ
jgi:hypothetical protein